MESLVKNGASWSLSVGIVVYQSDLAALKRCLQALSTAIDTAAGYVERESGEVLKASVFLLDNSQDSPYSESLSLMLAALTESLAEEKESPTEKRKSFSCQFFHRLLPCNEGYGAANNALLAEADSTYHLVLNPDVYLEPDALLVGLNYLRLHQDVVLLSPRVGEEHVVKHYPDCLTLMLRYVQWGWLQRLFRLRLNRYSKTDLTAETHLKDAVVGGCFMLMPTAAWKSVGGFDARFFLYFEDFDLSLRLAQLGKLAYVPSVHLYHDGGGVGRKNFNHHRYFAASAFKFFNKYGWRFV